LTSPSPNQANHRAEDTKSQEPGESQLAISPVVPRAHRSSNSKRSQRAWVGVVILLFNPHIPLQRLWLGGVGGDRSAPRGFGGGVAAALHADANSVADEDGGEAAVVDGADDVADGLEGVGEEGEH
jgi:hypothetical protein